jgi:D-glycero-alpha-D-manno-heptose-7-phosphate kinase
VIISRAPVRISFFGGGTDFPEYFSRHGGAVLASAIDKYSYVTASPFMSHLFDYSLKVSYRKNEAVTEVSAIEHPVFRECLRSTGFERDIELHTVADLPAFTGLGSSSSFTVSLLHALHAYKGEHVRPLDLARSAIRIERDVLGEAVGWQDQTTAAVGGFNVLEFRGKDEILVHRLCLSPDRLAELEAHLFVVFTGVKRRAAEIETRKVAGFARNGAVLSQMRAMVDEGARLLTEQGSLEAFGRLLHDAWIAKRGLEASVSNPEIDGVYRAGVEAGAWGGKLLGAGGGGFMLFVAPPERHCCLNRAFGDRVRLQLKLNAPGSQIIFH